MARIWKGSSRGVKHHGSFIQDRRIPLQVQGAEDMFTLISRFLSSITICTTSTNGIDYISAGSNASLVDIDQFLLKSDTLLALETAHKQRQRITSDSIFEDRTEKNLTTTAIGPAHKQYSNINLLCHEPEDYMKHELCTSCHILSIGFFGIRSQAPNLRSQSNPLPNINRDRPKDGGPICPTFTAGHVYTRAFGTTLGAHKNLPLQPMTSFTEHTGGNDYLLNEVIEGIFKSYLLNEDIERIFKSYRAFPELTHSPIFLGDIFEFVVVKRNPGSQSGF
ncbi:hypothetical protein M434DRAFT_38076 [Hypoxylon sp. CO27-5]|nr:hypothetical protein M434DRAFT_38076 [Hypoxylon sp. CO27-5]